MLRSINELINYTLKAEDDEIGRCKDFLFDDRLWVVRYILADTGKWLPGRKVLISLDWIESVSWLENEVKVDVTSEAIKNSPEFDPSQPVNREYEIVLYDYYGRPKYWER